MDHYEKLMRIIRTKGPVMPAQINKEMDTSVLIAGAMLSELVDKKKIKISSAKFGSSPVYYVDGQEPKLEMLYKYLHEKEQKAFDRLKQQKILADEEQEPVIRAALRAIKDFSKPLEITAYGHTALFWKWYQTSDEEAEKIIKDKLGFAEEQPEQPQAQPEQPQTVPHQVQPEQPQVTPQPAVVQEKSSIPKSVSEIQVQQEKPIESQTKLAENQQEEIRIKKEEEKPDDEFSRRIKKYFSRNEIEIIEQTIIRKNSEVDFVINVPSAVGKLQYFCKAKTKKKINDGDLSTAFIQGQMKKLPILFITLGDITKKANELLEKEFKNMTVKKLG
ncbi:hypothetical protein ACFL0W_02065 [Nanoarchaeota archaeon]